MAEVDLIPKEFRRALRLKRGLKACAIAYAVLVVTILTAKLLLGYTLKSEKGKIDALQSKENSILQQRQSYDELQAQRTHLEEYLTILQTLQGGPKAEEMFVVIDRAINDSVWITNLKFFRAGEKTAAKSEKQSAGGYMVLVPKGEKSAEEQWTNEVRMEITGQALNHSALAGFVKALQDQKEIAEVKLQNTSEKPYLSDYAISYQISVRVDSSTGGS